MTLAQLKTKSEALKIGGRVLPSDEALEAYQEMIFDHVFQLCDPLNLAIPYADSDVYRAIHEDGDVEWFLKKPRIATVDADYIDIDSRLDMAFVYYLTAFVANDKEKLMFEQKADRVCVEYACHVVNMGLPRAKEIYMQESFITAVHFDCMGRYYSVDDAFIDVVFDCLLEGDSKNSTMNASYAGQLDKYKAYLAGEAVKPVDLDAMRAVDATVYLRILNNYEDFAIYDAAALSKITTIYAALDDENHQDWVDALSKRLFLT